MHDLRAPHPSSASAARLLQWQEAALIAWNRHAHARADFTKERTPLPAMRCGGMTMALEDHQVRDLVTEDLFEEFFPSRLKEQMIQANQAPLKVGATERGAHSSARLDPHHLDERM